MRRSTYPVRKWKELSPDRPDLGTEEKVALMKKKLLDRILVGYSSRCKELREIEGAGLTQPGGRLSFG
jgi:hypothetical protein